MLKPRSGEILIAIKRPKNKSSISSNVVAADGGRMINRTVL
jgi:hypothetical protein